MGMKHFYLLIFIGLLSLLSCDLNNKEINQVSKSGAKQVEKMYQVPLNSRGKTVEQQNIDDRQRVTNDPTKIMWIHLISLDGNIIKRMPVRNKVTSSGKRLEPISAGASGEFKDFPQYENFPTTELLQPDGTYGSSDSYIFWFDPLGRYHQYGTAGGIGYLLTDYPIDLQNPMDEITGLYNASTTASKWQAEQEALLRKKEAK